SVSMRSAFIIFGSSSPACAPRRTRVLSSAVDKLRSCAIRAYSSELQLHDSAISRRCFNQRANRSITASTTGYCLVSGVIASSFGQGRSEDHRWGAPQHCAGSKSARELDTSGGRIAKRLAIRKSFTRTYKDREHRQISGHLAR